MEPEGDGLIRRTGMDSQDGHCILGQTGRVASVVDLRPNRDGVRLGKS